jgi:hypothetical protein
MPYQLTRSDSILRIADNAYIPPDARNSDYRAYEDWLAKGNTPEPYVEPVIPPPPTVTEKLNSMGITIADLKAELGSA